MNMTEEEKKVYEEFMRKERNRLLEEKAKKDAAESLKSPGAKVFGGINKMLDVLEGSIGPNSAFGKEEKKPRGNKWDKTWNENSILG